MSRREGDESTDPLREEDADDVPGASPPVVPGDHHVVQVQGLDEVVEILAERADLPAAEPAGLLEPGVPEAAQVRPVHPVTRLVQTRQHAVPAVDVVRPAVHRHQRPAVLRAVGFVGDPQGGSLDVVAHAGPGDPLRAPSNERSGRP
nr:hypothetical protein [Streptomyces sp. MK5]